MQKKLVPFDFLDYYLDSDEAIFEYLKQVLAEGDADELARALGHIARAKGVSIRQDLGQDGDESSDGGA